MAYRSSFPSQIDQFLDHYEISASDIPKVARFQELKLKTSRNPAEDTELSNLTTELRDKIIQAEDFNKFQDALVSMQIFIRDNVAGYINTMKSDILSYTDNAKNDITNTKNTFYTQVNAKETDVQNFVNQKKLEIQDILEETTAGQLSNRIDNLSNEKFQMLVEYNAQENPISILSIQEDPAIIRILPNVKSIAERNALTPQHNDVVYVTNEKQAYKYVSGNWNVLVRKKYVSYVWSGDDPTESLEKFYGVPNVKNASVLTSQTGNTVNVTNTIKQSDFTLDSTYMSHSNILYKVMAVAHVNDGASNHVSTNVTLNVPITTTAGQAISLSTAVPLNEVKSQFVYNNGILTAIKKTKRV